MKYIAILDDNFISNFRLDDFVVVVNDKRGYKRGIPLKMLKHPIIVNEDGEAVYLTQGHIDALLEYEDKQRQERVMRDVIDVIRKVNNNDPV